MNITTNPIYWELVDSKNKHSKFWAAKIRNGGTSYDYGDAGTWLLERRWGAIGTRGQQTISAFPSEDGAKTELRKLIKFKEREGYKPIF